MARLFNVHTFPNFSSFISAECSSSRSSYVARHEVLSQSPFRRSQSTLPARPSLLAGLKQSSLTQNLPLIPSSDALGMLRSQKNHYLVTYLVGKKYKLMVDDQVTVPHIKDLQVGDLVKLTRITEVGSRNFTLRAIGNGTVGHAKLETMAPPSTRRSRYHERINSQTPSRVTCLKPEIPHYLDEGLVDASAIVVEHTRGKMITVIKKKRRKGYRKTIKNKPYYTRLRLCEIKIPSMPAEESHQPTLAA